MPDIRLAAVSKIYPGGVRAVDRVELTIRDGEFLILLGPSGCGKSTTLRMIAGLEDITEGDLLLDGRRINDVDPKDRQLAFVFQNYALFPHMSVAANLTFGMRLRRVPTAEIESRLRAVVGLLGLGELLDRKPKELSGGQRQRVALGRALLRDPLAYLLDEPLSNLDAKLRAQMRTELVKLHRRLGRTIIHVTHDQVEAMTMGQRICIMNEGRIAQVGPPLDVYREPADLFVAGFLGSPPMNLLPAQLVQVDGRLRAEAPGFSLALSPAQHRALERIGGDRAVVLGVRPEALRPSPPGPDAQQLDVTTVAVEALGSEIILVGELDGSGAEIAARLPAESRITEGSRVALHLDPAELHLFDPVSGRALPRRPDQLT